MALGAVLISLPLAIIGACLIWASSGLHAFEAILAYAGFGTLALIAFALIKGGVLGSKTRRAR